MRIGTVCVPLRWLISIDLIGLLTRLPDTYPGFGLKLPALVVIPEKGDGGEIDSSPPLKSPLFSKEILCTVPALIPVTVISNPTSKGLAENVGSPNKDEL